MEFSLWHKLLGHVYEYQNARKLVTKLVEYLLRVNESYRVKLISLETKIPGKISFEGRFTVNRFRMNIVKYWLK